MTTKTKLPHPDLREPVFASVSAAAKRSGVPLAVLKRAKLAGCDGFDRKGRVYLFRVLAFVFAQSPKDEDGSPWDGLPTWRDCVNREQAKREKIKRQKDEGAVIDFATASRQIGEATALFADLWSREERELPPVMAGMDAIGIQKELVKFHRNNLDQLAEKWNAVGKNEGGDAE